MDEMLELLKNNQVFGDLSQDELQFLSPIISRKTFNKGELVFDFIKKPEYLFYIVNGSFTLGLVNNEYKVLKPGELIGEIGILNGDFRSGIIYAAELSSVISICGIRLFQEKYIPPRVTLKIVRSLSKRITSYLRLREQISTVEIIQQGESDRVEFKSTLRWNLFSKKKDKAIEKAVLKTLTAFMNSNGGVLIIGVEDNGNILGLENDQFANSDKLLLHLTYLIKERIGPLFLKYLHCVMEKIGKEEILRVDCIPAPKPAYFKDDNLDHFFIRNGPSTTDLRLSKVHNYIIERFDRN